MNSQNKNYSVIVDAFSGLGDQNNLGIKGKLFIGEELGLTGCEISLNKLPANTSFPFVHAHKKNEELYLIISGNGVFQVDDEKFPIQEGSLIRVAPAGERCIEAKDEELFYICVQAEHNSLSQSKTNDGFVVQSNTQQ